MEFEDALIFVFVKRIAHGHHPRLSAKTTTVPISISTAGVYHGRFKSWWSRLLEEFVAIQLAHYGGKYSVERMLALEEYTRNTSLARVLFVCFGAPLFVVAAVLVQESVPLQSPDAGWKANYGFWVRVGFVGVTIGVAGAIQIGFWLDIPPFSRLQIMVYSILMGVSYVTTGIATAEIWVFPVPFFMFTLGAATASIIVVYIRTVVGARAFGLLLSQREQLRRLIKIGLLQGFLYVAYPTYQLLFTHTNHTNYEIPTLLVLPVFRLVIKKIFASAAAHKEDMVPVQVVFTVDFFDALYLATFMQSLSSSTAAVLIAVDLIQSAIELQELHQRTRGILNRLRGAATDNSFSQISLLGAVRALCVSPEAMNKQTRAGVSVRSCISHRLASENNELLTRLENVWSAGVSPIGSRYPESAVSLEHKMKGWCRSRGAVQPQPIAVIRPQSSQTAGRYGMDRRISTANNDGIFKETLEVLFTSECLILTEYVEIIIPVLYGAFILTMVHQPSAQYHTEMIGVTVDNVSNKVSGILVYALLELVSFIVLAVITKRNCGINALYQLAFVLESQMLFVQSTLMMWIFLTLAYRVVHFGTVSVRRFCRRISGY